MRTCEVTMYIGNEIQLGIGAFGLTASSLTVNLPTSLCQFHANKSTSILIWTWIGSRHWLDEIGTEIGSGFSGNVMDWIGWDWMG